jgi:nucleoside-diphosphate-sugar epimerase
MKGDVALTGATGFIGGHLARRLVEDGWRVRVLSRRASALEGNPEVAVVTGSLEDRDALERLVEGVQVVIHCAGLVKGVSATDFHSVNALGTKRLVETVARRAWHARFIMMSSIVARSPEISPYAASKRAGEVEVMRRGGDLRWIILRPAAVYGPGDRATLPFFRQISRGIALFPSPPEPRVSLVHVRDLVASVAALLDTDVIREGIFEVGDQRPNGYTWSELIAEAVRALRNDGKVLQIPVPRSMCRFAASLNLARCVLFGSEARLTPAKVDELYHPDWVCRDEGLMRQTGWRPQMGLAEGFQETVAWYREQRWL